jgi:nucleotide sugar dehydrogenase
LALLGSASQITGFDVSEDRLRAIEAGDVDLSDLDVVRLAKASGDDSFRLTSDSATLAEADAVIVCVPTPVDEHHVPNLSALRSACQTVVAYAHPGQTVILTSTSFVGTTRQLLAEPLAARGLIAGTDVYVAFSPERIDPGNADHLQRETPRVVGGATTQCALRAARVIGQLTDSVYLVSSPEAAELTKLYENIFRAVTLALANEFSDVCGTLGLDPIEVTLAAATKPYGFLAAFPGPGVGGHCIPCDPHYLLWQLHGRNRPTPLIEQAMQSIHARPARVVERVAEVLAADGRPLAGAKVIVVGVSYKAGVSDVRESPALLIIDGLVRRGVDVGYHDSLVPGVATPEGPLHSVAAPTGADWDLAVIHVVHPDADYSWVKDCPRVLDATYLFEGLSDSPTQRSVV